MNHEAFILLHIPKAAGTTLNRIIEWQYNPLSIFTIDPHRIRATPERFKTLSEQRRRQLRVVRGHMFYGIHEFLPQGAAYITMLRDPVARLLSAYSFILRRPLNPMHRKLKRGRVGVEAFIRLTPNRQNLQCRMLAGVEDVTCDQRVLDLAKEDTLHKKEDWMRQALAALDSIPKPGPVQRFCYSTVGASRFLVSKIMSAL